MPLDQPAYDALPIYDPMHLTGHAVSIATVISAWLGWLPALLSAVATTFIILFYIVQLYESRSFQHWRNNRLMKSRARKLAKLRAREKITLAKITALETVRQAKHDARGLVAEATANAAADLAHVEVDVQKKG